MKYLGKKKFTLDWNTMTEKDLNDFTNISFKEILRFIITGKFKVSEIKNNDN